jgi:hypothetical protein
VNRPLVLGYTATENARRDAENAELKTRVTKLEQDSSQSQNDSHFEEAVAVQLKEQMLILGWPHLFL